MKEITSIINHYEELTQEDKKLALATVIHVENSSYRRSGARMLIAEDGSWIGGISGGCLERDALKNAQYALYKNEPVTVRYDTRDDDPNQIGVGLGCNGLIDILIAPIEQTDPHNAIATLKECSLKRAPSVLLTIVESPDKDYPVGTLIPIQKKPQLLEDLGSDALLDDLALVWKHQKSQTKTYETNQGAWKIFIEFLPPPIHLFIYGRNYDTVPLAQLAKAIGWKVTLASNPLKVSKALFEAADHVWDLEKGMPPVDLFSAAIIMAHDVKTDQANLGKVLQTDIPYIGLLGPKKRRDKILNNLKEAGIAIDQDRLFAPVGLDTGATTPEEIAVAILAEIRAVFSNREGGFLRKRKKPIND